MKNFNTDDAPAQLTEVIQIGWQHEIAETDEGKLITYALDDNGDKIPTTYEIPVSLSTSDLLQMVRKLGSDNLNELGERLAGGDIDVMLELAGLVYGDVTVLAIAGDPTVSLDAFVAFCQAALGTLGFGEARPPVAEDEDPTA